jgi:CDGSH-type Zn-finger protein/uncharacterized Fe-S cluster protein YjdI
MEEDIHEYRGEDVVVTYDSNRCIHVRECVEGLPAVFDVDRRPWVAPDEAGADEVATVVERCPTGALHYERSDGGAAETVPSTNTVTATSNGPLYVHGDVVVRTPDVVLLEDTRVGLCRCGHSSNKPLCDNSHSRVFDAGGTDGTEDETDGTVDPDGPDGEAGTRRPDPESAPVDGAAGAGTLTVTATPDGPFRLEGAFDLRSRDAGPSHHEEAALCRCGSSDEKPFCDGTHAKVGFSTADGE